MRRTWILFLMVLSVSPMAFAGTSTHRQAAEEVLLLTRSDEILEPFLQQIQQMNLPQEAYESAQKYIRRINELASQEMQWQRIKGDYINLYVSLFTEPELRELIQFYKSPIGHKLIEKTPVLMQKSMQIGHEKMMRIMPEIQAISEEMKQELQQYRSR
jgi:hypothetical protein